MGGFDGLKAGESKIALVKVMLYGGSGTRMTFKCVIDPDNVIPESDETNNESGVITVEVQ
jgi:subtilase family serine protease